MNKSKGKGTPASKYTTSISSDLTVDKKSKKIAKKTISTKAKPQKKVANSKFTKVVQVYGN